jgi:hypothetical protein
MTNEKQRKQVITWISSLEDPPLSENSDSEYQRSKDVLVKVSVYGRDNVTLIRSVYMLAYKFRIGSDDDYKAEWFIVGPDDYPVIGTVEEWALIEDN